AGSGLQFLVLPVPEAELVQRRLQRAHFVAPLAALEHTIGEWRGAFATRLRGACRLDATIGDPDGGVLGRPVLGKRCREGTVTHSGQRGIRLPGHALEVLCADVVDDVAPGPA